jgi:cytochrome P450
MDQVKNYEELMLALENPLRTFLPWYAKLPLPSNLRINRSFDAFEHFILQIIESKKRKLSSIDAILPEETDILDAMIASHLAPGEDSTQHHAGEHLQDEHMQYEKPTKDQKLSDRELLHNVILFFIAGHETSSSALAMTLHMLEQNPDIQDRARKEVVQVLGAKLLPDWEDIRNLTYLECCIKETLRLYPPAAFISRQLDRDSVIGGYFVPKDTFVTVPQWTIHRDPDLWADPDRYNPDRFLNEKIDSYTWLPFSLGPRQCLGINFAMLELRIVLAFLLRKFRFLPDPNTKAKFDYDITTTIIPAKGHTLLLEPIKG